MLCWLFLSFMSYVEIFTFFFSKASNPILTHVCFRLTKTGQTEQLTRVNQAYKDDDEEAAGVTTSQSSQNSLKQRESSHEYD